VTVLAIILGVTVHFALGIAMIAVYIIGFSILHQEKLKRK
jgi:uncharacterized membrane protein